MKFEVLRGAVTVVGRNLMANGPEGGCFDTKDIDGLTDEQVNRLIDAGVCGKAGGPKSKEAKAAKKKASAKSKAPKVRQGVTKPDADQGRVQKLDKVEPAGAESDEYDDFDDPE